MISVVPRQASESSGYRARGSQQAAGVRRLEFIWNGPTEEEDVGQQIALAERAIHRDNNLDLILSPSNPFALNAAIQRSLVRGMSVVTVGTPVSLKPDPCC